MMLHSHHFSLSCAFLLVCSVSAISLEGAAVTSQLAIELEDLSQGFKLYNWSTSIPDPGPIVVANGQTMPPKVLVMSHDGSVVNIWPPGTFFSWEQWAAVSGQNLTHHEQELVKRYANLPIL